MKWAFLSFRKYSDEMIPERWLESISHYRGVLEALAPKNEVTSLDGISFNGLQTYKGVHYYFMNNSGLSLFVKSFFYLKQYQPEILLIHSFQFPIQTLALKILLGNKIRILIQNHAERPPDNPKILAQKWVGPYIDGFLFCSGEMGMQWMKKGIIKNSDKIHEVMEVSSFFEPVSREKALNQTQAQGFPIFLWVGRLDRNKDPLTVVQGFLKYLQTNSKAKLYMIYQSDELLRPIQDMVKNSEFTSQIFLIGRIPHKELLYWYNSADFFISGSHYEGSGTAVSEAMACSCIPILTNIDSFRMMTDLGKIGYLYPPGNPEALTKILKGLNPDNIEKNKVEVRRNFESRLSFMAIARDFQKIADDLKS